MKQQHIPAGASVKVEAFAKMAAQTLQCTLTVDVLGVRGDYVAGQALAQRLIAFWVSCPLKEAIGQLGALDNTK